MENHFTPDITNVIVSLNGSPNRLYSNGIYGKKMREEFSRFFDKTHRKNMSIRKFFTENKFGVFITLPPWPKALCVHLERALELERNGSGSGKLNCHFFAISDSQLNIMDRHKQKVCNICIWTIAGYLSTFSLLI